MALSSSRERGAVVREQPAICLRCGRPLKVPSIRKGVLATALLALVARVLFYVAVVVIAFSAFVLTTSAVLASRPHRGLECGRVVQK
jgi:hypothetical protein